ncbi:hypothetical protein BDW02DRAFT_549149 [Decorospora gaudefroyi]|uniref:Mis14-domain-containing protein n=1 Tax=Decorospora gaudefroyi TaxID=184978 RepID=A0A6A5KG97_9PLEO|nr:hypothetical protein BDW02DRAFT_549149 [Decorospora gaudefroyi]
MATQHHRKIDLQSPTDLTHLTTQLRTAALQKLNLHLPPLTTPQTDPDDLRLQVEHLVHTFVAQIEHGMRQNVSINGVDVVSHAEEADVDRDVEVEVDGEEFEPYDEKLRSKLSAMVARRDALVAGISCHRRDTPGVAARVFRERWEAENGVLFSAAGGEPELESESAVDAVLVRGQEVGLNWERAVAGLLRLDKGLPETRARLERAGGVVGYLDGRGE